jgi:sensor domain CHASE-containing protein
VIAAGWNLEALVFAVCAVVTVVSLRAIWRVVLEERARQRAEWLDRTRVKWSRR